ncbi:fatty-acid amide hydrolase 2-A-like [Neocloeon triangulifer]|uniref:fatty-acid amide hydrolase 2-A-like n=1 Tax=Neocloeon triangulifer TaxID=2078957 RepID=UPI00286F98AA|nr:fatty-acid amide hydrolase 2-A-like [Neocloeon triangulifer]
MMSKGGNQVPNYAAVAWKGLFIFLRMLHSLYDCIIDFFFGLYYNDTTRKHISNVDHPFLLESASSIARKIRNGDLKSVDVINACIARIAQVNGVINAVVDERFKDAIEEAKEADRMIESGEWSKERLEKERPFHGVPISMKEIIGVKGMRWTFGLILRKNERAAVDAEVTKSMRTAGAIPFVLTNIPELSMWYETRCNVYGQTNNPYDTNRTVGGSSGGESSLISACGSPLGIGTDIGGSIRMPAYFCGIFGHKPSTGMINLQGIIRKLGENTERSMTVPGPLCRYAEDLLPSMKVLMRGSKVKLDLETKVDVKNLRIFYIEDDCGDLKVSPISSDQKDALKKAVKYLGELTGKTPKKLELPNWKYGYKLWRYMITQEPERLPYELTNRNGTVTWWWEVLRFFTGTSPYTLPSIMRLIDMQMPQANPQWAKDTIKSLLDDLKREMGEDGVLLYPTHPIPAFYHCSAHLQFWNITYTAIINALKLPATQVPMGLNSKGLPLGVQVIGNMHCDRMTIAVAEELEKAFGGWVSPFKTS